MEEPLSVSVSVLLMVVVLEFDQATGAMVSVNVTVVSGLVVEPGEPVVTTAAVLAAAVVIGKEIGNE